MSDDSGTMDAEPRQGMFSKIGSFLSRSGTVSLPNGSSNSESKPLNPNGKSTGNAEEPMTYEKLLEVFSSLILIKIGEICAFSV